MGFENQLRQIASRSEMIKLVQEAPENSRMILIRIDVLDSLYEEACTNTSEGYDLKSLYWDLNRAMWRLNEEASQ